MLAYADVRYRLTDVPCGLSAGKGLSSSIEAIYTPLKAIYSSFTASIELNRAGGVMYFTWGQKLVHIYIHMLVILGNRDVCANRGGGFLHAIKNKK
jgi:hypothetical protein